LVLQAWDVYHTSLPSWTITFPSSITWQWPQRVSSIREYTLSFSLEKDHNMFSCHCKQTKNIH
jgi:hypothetical protein